MKPSKILFVMLLALVLASGLSAQNAISARAGLVNVADGDVFLAGKAVEPKPAEIVQIGRAAQKVPMYLEVFQVRRSQFFGSQGHSGDGMCLTRDGGRQIGGPVGSQDQGLPPVDSSEGGEGRTGVRHAGRVELPAKAGNGRGQRSR